jgi:hypothetical protein
MSLCGDSFNHLVLDHWDSLSTRLLSNNADGVNVDGQTLDIASVVAIARYADGLLSSITEH